MSEEF